jgi:hypothetical protein
MNGDLARILELRAENDLLARKLADLQREMRSLRARLKRIALELDEMVQS